MYSRISRNVIKNVGGKCRLRSEEWKDNRILILSHKSCRLENQMPSLRYMTFSGVRSFISQRIQIHLGFCLLFVLFSREWKTLSISVRNKRKPRPCSKAAVTRAIFLLAMVMRFFQFHGMSLIQTSFIRDHSHKFHLVSSLFVSLSVATFCVLTDPPWVASDLEQKVTPYSSPGKDLT